MLWLRIGIHNHARSFLRGMRSIKQRNTMTDLPSCSLCSKVGMTFGNNVCAVCINIIKYNANICCLRCSLTIKAKADNLRLLKEYGNMISHCEKCVQEWREKK